MIEKVIDKSEYLCTDLGETKPIIRLGGLDSIVGSKYVPNANLSFQCFSGEEKYFINLNRKDRVVTTEEESFSDSTIILQIDNQADIWHEENGHLKWDIRFDSKPKSFIIDFEMLCSPEIKFAYQPHDLTQFEIDQGSIRPDNVKGSYAIFINKSGCILDSNRKVKANYLTGKLGHIYRPLCIDADGKKEWAELFIDKSLNLLRITLPETFMNSAQYPVILDPDLGYDAQGGSSASGADDVRGLHKLDNSYLQVSASADQLSSVTHYCTTGSITIECGIYDHDGSNNPQNLVASNTGTSQVGATEISVTTALTPSAYYSPACYMNTGGAGFYYDSDADSLMLYDNNVNPNQLLDPWEGGHDEAYKVSIFFTYTESSGVSWITDIQGTSTTPSIAHTISRALSADITGASTTPNVIATLIRGLIADIQGQSTTPEISATLARALLTDIQGASTTPEISTIIARALTADIQGSSVTPSIAAIIQRVLSTNIIGSSTTPGIVINILRSLIANIVGSSVTPEITITIEGAISWITNIVGSSVTPSISQTMSRNLPADIQGISTTSSIAAIIARSLIANIAGASVTPEITISTIRSLIANIVGSSVTPEIVAILEGVISWIANITGASTTPEISVNIIRGLQTNIQGQSVTPDDVAAIWNEILFVVDPSIISLTPERAITSLTPTKTIQSITPIRTIEEI